MGLMLPPPRGMGSANQFSATPGSATTRGITVAANASANTKGSWVEMIASTTYSVIGIGVSISNLSLATAVRRSFFDIGVGAAAAEQVLIANHCMLGTANLTNQASPQEVYYPVRVPSGTRISARHQCSTGSQSSQVQLTVYYGNWHEHRTFAGAEMANADTSTTSLTAITAGNTGAESAWTSAGSTTTRAYYGGLLCVTMNTSTALTALTYHGEWGFNSTTMGEMWFQASASELVGGNTPTPFQYVPIASGTQLQARAECSGTGEALQYGVMCLY
jgi:hypothetical protein